jgi:hypothetical protein
VNAEIKPLGKLNHEIEHICNSAGYAADERSTNTSKDVVLASTSVLSEFSSAFLVFVFPTQLHGQGFI